MCYSITDLTAALSFLVGIGRVKLHQKLIVDNNNKDNQWYVNSLKWFKYYTNTFAGQTVQ